MVFLSACGDGQKPGPVLPEEEEPRVVEPGEGEQANRVEKPLAEEAEDGEFILAEIMVQPRDDIRVHWLREDGSRVIGRLKAPFHFVHENLEGSKFTRVRGQLTPVYDIKVTKSGYLYVLKGEDDDLAKTGLMWEERTRDLKGEWLDDVHRTKVEAGDELHMSWFELSFIAGDITLKKWLPEED